MKYKNVRLLFILIVAGSVVLAAVKASSVDKKSALETNRNAEAVDDNLEKL